MVITLNFLFSLMTKAGHTRFASCPVQQEWAKIQTNNEQYQLHGSINVGTTSVLDSLTAIVLAIITVFYW